MRPRVVDAVPYTLVLGALSILYLGNPTSNQPGPVPLPSAVSRVLAAREAVCRLSVAQQVKAVKAFREMMPVFRHPRCFNCHGGFDITSDAHEGSDAAKSSGLDPRSLLTAKERKELHAECGSCHDNVRGTLTRLDGTQIAGWLVAPLPMLWIGKSDEQLCLDMKRFERDGDQFIDHIERDHNEIQFVEAAFNGDRALGAALTSYGLRVEKPPGTQADLVAKARRWVASLNGVWKDPRECGCVMPKIKLQVHHTWRGLADVPLSTKTSEALFDVSLTPMGDERPNYYQGQISLERHINLTLPPGCTGRASSVKERWVLYAFLDPQSGSVRVWHSQLPETEGSSHIQCKQYGTFDEAGDWADPIGNLGQGEWLVIPADSTSKTVVASFLGTKESLTITVLEVPATQ
jgi:hypothetical protein